MYLHVPGLKTAQKRHYNDEVLAHQFWQSTWGKEVLAWGAAHAEASVLCFLTEARELGGMEATWEACDGFRPFIKVVSQTRPSP